MFAFQVTVRVKNVTHHHDAIGTSSGLIHSNFSDLYGNLCAVTVVCKGRA